MYCVLEFLQALTMRLKTARSFSWSMPCAEGRSEHGLATSGSGCERCCVMMAGVWGRTPCPTQSMVVCVLTWFISSTTRNGQGLTACMASK